MNGQDEILLLCFQSLKSQIHILCLWFKITEIEFMVCSRVQIPVYLPLQMINLAENW